MIIRVDIDAVALEIHQKWLDLYFGEYRHRLHVRDIDRWAMHELVVPECGLKIYDYLKDPHFYDGVEPVEGAVEGIKQLRGDGHDVVFVSSGLFPQKVKRLYELGMLLPCRSWEWAKDAVLTDNKALIRGDVTIDDYWVNLEGVTWPILFSRPWNEAKTGVWVRARDWGEVVHSVRNIQKEMGRHSKRSSHVKSQR